MEVLMTTNGALTMVIVPNNEMEVQMLKQLAIQQNEITFTDNGIQIVNKSVPQGLVISKQTGSTTPVVEDNNQEQDTSMPPPEPNEEYI